MSWSHLPLAAVLAFPVLIASAGQEQTQPAPSFRSRITMIPVDVRVLDRDGSPVTDLRQEDFTILEDGRPQRILHFSTRALSADTGVAALDADALRPAVTPELRAQNRRVFLLVLGRGRLDGPFKELDALRQFVTRRLLPQDQVALLAYNRATPFTTDHARLLATIDAFRQRQAEIEALLAHRFSGLQAVYGGTEMPADIQKKIDALFAAPGQAQARAAMPGLVTDAERLAQEQRRTADALQRAEILAGRTGEFASLPDAAAEQTVAQFGMSFDDYIARQHELMRDVSNVYAGINYLRYIDGEKHLVFVTPKGLALPRREDHRNLAAIASDARIALDVVYTGGSVAAAPARAVMGQIIMSPLPSQSAVFAQTFMIADARTMTDMTGGRLTAFTSLDKGFASLDAATRFVYLLAYSSSNTSLDGGYRRVTVRVNRPGVTIAHRGGYFASRDLVPLDRRQQVTSNRILAAASYDGRLDDIEVSIGNAHAEQNPARVVINARLRSRGVRFVAARGRHKATLEVVVYCADAAHAIVGQTNKVVELDLNDAGYGTYLDRGARIDVELPVTGVPRFVKVIVYDYASDRLGTAIIDLKPGT